MEKHAAKLCFKAKEITSATGKYRYLPVSFCGTLDVEGACEIFDTWQVSNAIA